VWTEQGPVVGSCEHGNESLGSIKDLALHDQLSDCQHLKEAPSACS